MKWWIQEERVDRGFLGGGVRGRGAGGVMGVLRWWRKREDSRVGVSLRRAVCVRHKWHVAAGVLTTRGILTRRLSRSVHRAWAQRRGAGRWEGSVLVGRLGRGGGSVGIGSGLGLAGLAAFTWEEDNIKKKS